MALIPTNKSNSRVFISNTSLAIWIYAANKSLSCLRSSPLLLRYDVGWVETCGSMTTALPSWQEKAGNDSKMNANFYISMHIADYIPAWQLSKLVRLENFNSRKKDNKPRLNSILLHCNNEAIKVFCTYIWCFYKMFMRKKIISYNTKFICYFLKKVNH